MMGRLVRIDKFLTDMNQGSRSQVKDAIRKGKVSVDGQICREADLKLDPNQAKVRVNGALVTYAAVEYYMLHKPQGVVSATEDRVHRTVLDLLGGAGRKDLFPVGRLDIDTEGLLIITNDGGLAHELLSPRKHVDKVYFARVMGRLPADITEQFAKGMQLSDGTPVLPARLLIESSYETDRIPVNEVRLTIREGKYHQVKRMFEAVGAEVLYLKRLSMGTLCLDEALKPGQFRPLRQEEITRLKLQAESSRQEG